MAVPVEVIVGFDSDGEPETGIIPNVAYVPPKMPRLMKTVYKQIEEHPNFKAWLGGPDSGNRFGYVAARDGFSWCTKENNKWIRSLWRHFYLGEQIES